jgi:hypothetical protein
LLLMLLQLLLLTLLQLLLLLLPMLLLLLLPLPASADAAGVAADPTPKLSDSPTVAGAKTNPASANVHLVAYCQG